jgi:hypothetical protein
VQLEKDRALAKKIEEEATQRKTQEEKDRELARQLDRELNLGEAPGRDVHIPGEW